MACLMPIANRPGRRFDRRACVAIACVSLMMLTACSSPDEPAADDEADVVVEDVEEVEDEVTTDADAPEDEAAEPEPESVVEEDPPRPDLGLPEMVLTTPAEGGGQWPELAWESVPDADQYAVTVYDPDDVAYWAWQGTDVSVIAGGFDPAPPEGSGVAPRIRAGMTWDVVALDESGGLIAQSGVRPISP
ncbi:MAG: hypothetical protein EA388_12700 [Nitriliruptor sp.]|nr:MAG: hypothetical protein EA388_12700 [Nitriliruptor sp.]